jgi:hypothetical protein
MKIMLRSLLVVVVLIAVASVAQMAGPAAQAAQAPAAQPAKAAAADSNEIVHLYHCSLGEGVTEEALETAVQDWLKALRALDGGEGIKIEILWPVAAQMGDKDFMTVVTYPSFTSWGRSWEAYKDDTAAAKWEALQGEKWACPDSDLWEGVDVEASK